MTLARPTDYLLGPSALRPLLLQSVGRRQQQMRAGISHVTTDEKNNDE
jgi:hypothetical protein